MKVPAKLVAAVKLSVPIILLMILLSATARFENFQSTANNSAAHQSPLKCNVANSVIVHATTTPTSTPRFQFFLHPPGKDLYISDAAYASGGNSMSFFESGERNYMLNTLKKYPGAEILDIGANVGTHTFFFGLSGYKVHAFEPLKANFHLLECTVKTNEMTNIKLNNLALGPKHAELCMHPEGIEINNIGGVHLTNVSASECDPSIAVKVAPLGEYLERNNVKPVFIKIDIEGSEFNALTSAKDWLRKYPPKHIYTEFSESNMKKLGAVPEDYWNLLADLGYKVYNTEDTEHYKTLRELPDTSASNIFIHAVHGDL